MIFGNKEPSVTFDRGDNLPRGDEIHRDDSRLESFRSAVSRLRAASTLRDERSTGQNVNETQPIAIRENDRSHGLRNGEREMQTWPFGGHAVRNCEAEESRMVSAADKNDRYSFLKRIQMWQRLRHCDAGMDMARCGTAGRWIGRSRPGAKIVRRRFLNLGRAGRE